MTIYSRSESPPAPPASPRASSYPIAQGFELLTQDPDEASEFYNWLLSLDPRARESRGSSNALVQHGILSIRSPNSRSERTGWLPEFVVADLAAAWQRANEHAFTVVKPGTPSDKRMRVSDRDGVHFMLSEGQHPPDVRPDQTTTYVIDYWSKNAAIIGQDYATLLGASSLIPEGDQYRYRLLHTMRRPVMAVMEFGHGAAIPDWFPYFRVGDIDQVTNLSMQAGCGLRIPPSHSPVDRFAMLEDPFGNLFCLSSAVPVAQRAPSWARNDHDEREDFSTILH